MNTSEVIKLSLLSILLIVVGCTKQEEVDEYNSSSGSNDSHGHGHSHDSSKTPNMGILAPFSSGEEQRGVAELKLHDDKGDLELWLTGDEAGTQPFDLPLDSVITVSFSNLEKKTVELEIRNREKNEDEAGKGNIRSEKTNYFIFPGDTGADASFLVGKDFVTEVTLSFTADGVLYTTDPFELRPHTH